MLHRHEHGAAPFAADAEALRDAEQDQRHGGPRADLLVGRQQADQERGDAHHDECQHEHRLASDPVAVVADDDAAERAGDEADGVGAEGRQRAGQRIEGRKEQAIEDERRGRSVEEEVVPLDGRADQARESDGTNGTAGWCVSAGVP